MLEHIIGGGSLFNKARVFLCKTKLTYAMGISLIALTACSDGRDGASPRLDSGYSQDTGDNADIQNGPDVISYDGGFEDAGMDAHSGNEVCIDNDRDGFYIAAGCGLIDCDDNDDTVFPGARERCDYKDNNCNNQIDEGVLQNYFRDDDEDGSGDVSEFVEDCVMPEGHVANSDDCNDNNETINPSARELCDKIDNDCNHTIDDDCECFVDETAECGETDLGECEYGTQVCSIRGEWSECLGYIGRIREVCDGLDNDCDGFIDDGVLRVFHLDQDGDGFGDPESTVEDCVPPDGYVENRTDCDDSNPMVWRYISAFVDGDDDGFGAGEVEMVCSGIVLPQGYALNDLDCNDENRLVHPNARELCNGDDDNCNREIDEGYDIGEVCSIGIGECYSEGVIVCAENSQESFCNAIPGEAREEFCDGSDNDCDGEVDEELERPSQICHTGIGECREEGLEFRVCLGGGWSDEYIGCTAFASEPEEEQCNGLDDDCDGEVDEAGAVGCISYNRDNDRDEFGLCEDVQCLCQPEWPYNVISQEEVLSDTGEVALNGVNPNDQDDITLGGWSYSHAPHGDHYGKYSRLSAFEGELGIQLKGHGTNIEADIEANTGTASVKTRMVATDDGAPITNFVSSMYLQKADRSEAVGLRTIADDYSFYYHITSNARGFILEVIPGGCSHDNFNWWTYTIELTQENEAILTVDDGVNTCSTQVPHGIEENFGKLWLHVDKRGSGHQWAIADYDNLSFSSDSCDCNDDEELINPNSPEKCNGLDDDCDGEVDEDFPVGEECFIGLGECQAEANFTCKDDGSGVVCDDEPLEPEEEVCDGLDNDCDGEVDEGDVCRIVFASDGHIYSIDVGGNEQPILLTNNDTQDQHPSWSPDRRKIAYDTGGRESFTVYTMDANGGNFEPIVEGLEPSWSPDGENLVYRTHAGLQICTINLDSRETNCLIDGKVYGPSWSPDGSKIAFTTETDGQDISIYHLVNGLQEALTNYEAITGEPNWHPDSNQLVFSSDKDGPRKIFRMNLDDRIPERISGSNTLELHPALSPDGSKIVFHENGPRSYRISVMDIDGENRRVVVDTPEDDITPDW